MVVEATPVVVVVGAVDSRSALVSDVVVDGAIVTVGSGGAVVVGSAMAVIAPVLVEVGIAASTVVVVEASIVPSVVDPATAVVGDSVTGVVVGAEGTATGPSPPPHAPASRKKSAIVQSARTSLIIPRVFQDEEVEGLLYLVAIAPALGTSEGFGVGVGAAAWAEVRALLVVPPVARSTFHRPPLFCAAQASPSAGLSRLAVRLTAGVFPAVLEATGGASRFESTGGPASTAPRDRAPSS
ncbi:MAG: hypothetical protein MKZ66_10730, partial [Acidimicrobiales bacterium]|nr:hypothetical protein [Acidimicrobiales bacterium]